MRYRFLGVLSLLVLLSVNMISGERAATRRDGNAMARYYFMKGIIAETEGKNDAAYEFYKKAYKADTNYVDGAFQYAIMRMALDYDTLATHEQKMANLRMMQKLIDSYPADLQAGMHYAYLASFLDTVPEAIRVLDRLEKAHPKQSVIQIYKANAYASMGESDSAIKAIKHYERLEGMSFETSLRKLRYHMMNNDTVGGILEIDELINANPSNPEYVTYKAKVYEMLDMPDSAFKYFNHALRLDPEDGMAKSELAQLYAQRGDSVAYDSLISEALMSDNLALEVKTQILAQYLQRMVDEKADLNRSDIIFNKLLEQYPHEPEVLFIGAKYSATKGDYDEAIRQLRYASDLDAQNPRYVDPEMSYLLLDDRPDEAMKVYEQALANNEQLNKSASLIYITASQEAGRYPRAIATLDSLIREIAPDLSVADSAINLSLLRECSIYDLLMLSDYYQMAGDVYYKAENLPETFRCYEDAITIIPDNNLALNNYAYFLVEKGGATPGSPDFEKAKKMSKAAVDNTEQNGTPFTYLDTYAWILFTEKDYEEALKYQELAVYAAGDDIADVELLDHYGDILFMNGKTQEALEQWEKALKLDPDNELLKKKISHKTYFEK